MAVRAPDGGGAGAADASRRTSARDARRCGGYRYRWPAVFTLEEMCGRTEVPRGACLIRTATSSFVRVAWLGRQRWIFLREVRDRVDGRRDSFVSRGLLWPPRGEQERVVSRVMAMSEI